MSRDFPIRKNIRLKNFDYSQRGAYFVTTCTQFRQCLFGDIIDDQMRLNGTGKMVEKIWDEIPIHYSGVHLGSFVVMPNHMHGIIELDNPYPVGAGSSRPCLRSSRPCLRSSRPCLRSSRPNCLGTITVKTGAITAPLRKSTLGQIMAYFKYQSTKRINHDKKPPYPRIWQRNYHEHIIRNERDYERICEYIINNPLQWTHDRENPNKL